MLKSASPLSQSHLESRLEGTSMLRPGGGGRGRRSMVAGLMLTSLVDAFSILVIFLIMNHSTNQEVIDLGQKIVLPQAMESQFIQSGVTVRIDPGGFNVEGKTVALSQLISTLKAINAAATEPAKKEGIVIVADRNLDYAELSPVILAGSQSGFTKFKFAVIRKD